MLYNDFMRRSIPNVTPSFCGREKEIKTLLSASSDHNVILIEGIAGIGKTSVTVSVAQELDRNGTFKDRVLFLTCKPAWNEHDLFVEIVHRIADFSGDSSLVANAIQNSANQVVSLLEQNSLALFIDDFQLVENPSTIELITEAVSELKASRLVVSTRKRPAIPPILLADIFELKLSGLNRKAATELINDLFELHSMTLPTQEKTDDIYNLINGHPYSLKLFISLIISGGYSLDSLLEQTEEFHEAMEESILSKIWDSLSESQHDLLTRLSLFRTAVNPDELGIKLDKKLRAELKDLFSRFVLDRDMKGRIFLHDLMRYHASEKLSEDEKKSLHLVSADVFLKRDVPRVEHLKEAYYHLIKARQVNKAIDILIELSWKVYTQASENENIFHLIDDGIFICDGYRQQELYGSRVLLLTYWRKFQEVEELLPLLESNSDLYYFKARMLFRKKRFTECCQFFEKALDEQGTNEKRKADIYGTLAYAYNKQGNITKAEHYFRIALKTAEKYPFICAKNFLNYAIFLSDRGNLQKALEFSTKAETIFSQLNALGRVANVLYNRSIYLRSLNKQEEAIECLDRALQIRESINDSYGMIYVHNVLASIAFEEGDTDKALEYFHKGMELALRNNWTYPQAFLNSSLGQTYLSLGKLTEAEAHYRTALSLFSDSDDPTQLNATKIGYSVLCAVNNDQSKAIQLLEEVREFAQSSERPDLSMEADYYLARIYADNGNPDLAMERKQELQELLSALSPESRHNMIASMQQFEKETGLASGISLTVHECGHTKNITDQTELKQIRDSKEKRDIHIDFEIPELYIRGKKVPFFKKKTLVTLLSELTRYPGQPVEPKTLFRSVWNRDFDADSDGANLRMSISRLRKALGQENDFILSETDQTGYCFNTSTVYCIITPCKDSFL